MGYLCAGERRPGEIQVFSLDKIYHTISNPYQPYQEHGEDVHYQWWFGKMEEANHKDQYGKWHRYYRSNKYRVEWEAIILEWDGDFSLDQALDKYKDYAFWWYTTKSHQIPKGNSPASDRFRFIFPLAFFVPDVYFRGDNGRTFLSSFAPEADPQSLINWHKVPLYTETYRYGCSNGKRILTEDDIVGHCITRERIERPKQVRSKPLGAAKRINNPQGHKLLTTQRYAVKLNEIPRYATGGKRYHLFRNIIYAMAKEECNGEYLFAPHEIEHLILSHTNDDKRRSMLASTLKKRERGEL